MSNVRPVTGEPNRYEVDSFKSSHDSQSSYIVDVTLRDFGCACGNFDYNLRPIWNEMKKLGIKKPNEAVYCKHIKAVLEYRKNNNG